MTAKETFLKSAHRAKFEALSETETFRTALEYALLVMVEDQPMGGSINDSWDCHSQVVGARRFMEILSRLHLDEKPRKLPTFPNLKPT